MEVVYASTRSAVEAVLRGSSAAQPRVALRPVTEDMSWVEAEAAVIFDVPDDVLAGYAQRDNGRRSFLVPADVAGRQPVVALRGVEQRRRRRPVAAAAALVFVVLGAAAAIAIGVGGSDPDRDSATTPGRAETSQATPRAEPERPAVKRRRPPSRAVGLPTDGRLVNGVPFPASGRHHFTWDATRGRSPNPRFRRFATDRTVRRILDVLAGYARAHPRAARIGVADLSLPRGGEFGLRYGGSGHLTHQNGLDVDVLYPRVDGAEKPATGATEVDNRLAQDLLNRFVAAGAEEVFIGSRIGLEATSDVVRPRRKHDDHMHIRLPR